MRIKVYQIDAEKDSKGLGYEHDRKAMAHGRADPAIYQCVFHGDIDGTALDDVYDAFHTFNHPYTGTYQGRPISDSDVVEVTPEQPGKSPVEPGCYFRGGTGWEKIEFDTSQCAEMKGIRVLMLLPGKAPVETRVINKLSCWQKAVSRNGEESLIEITVPFKDGTLTVSNEEAKLCGMEGNRRINGQIYAGPVLLVNDDGNGDFCDLTDRQIAGYTDRFAQPEDISQEEVQSDIGFIFHAW